MSEKIFIQIASYRDPELVPTIEDCIAKSKNPQNLRFCIAWQHSDTENLDKYKTDPRFKILDIPYALSKGACWARNLIQQNYNEEEYTLQLDSHHRFVENWDQLCINTIKELQSKGHKKPLLTTYAPSYDPDNDPNARIQVPWQMNFDRFIPEGAVFFLPASIPNYQQLTDPIPARFYSAHFCFTLGQFCKEVPHDPEYYFHGEEISIAVRAYTWGYDLFHPHKVIVWHEYTRKNRTKHWDDDKNWGEKNSKSHLKNRILFNMENENQNVKFSIYGFGDQRTLQDYEAYAGISFSKRAVQKYTVDHNTPPNPVYKTDKEFEDSFLKIFKHSIPVHKSVLPKAECDFWAVILEDETGNCLYRKDLTSTECKRLIQTADEFVNIWVEFNTDIHPHKWIVWPHAKVDGWLERIEQFI